MCFVFFSNALYAIWKLIKQTNMCTAEIAIKCLNNSKQHSRCTDRIQSRRKNKLHYFSVLTNMLRL